MTLELANAAYLAGLIDGEGTISLHKLNRKRDGRVDFRPHLSFANTDKEIVEWVRNTAGFGYIARQPLRPHRKVVYVWRSTCWSPIIKILIELLPYLRIKKKQAELLLEFHAHPSEKKQWVWAHRQRDQRGWLLPETAIIPPAPMSTWKDSKANEMRRLNRRGTGTP